jgi:ribosome-associated translation inhibitor RaiA
MLQTPLQITYHGLDPSSSFDQLIRERADRLEAMHDRITSCRVVVEVPHRAPGTGKVSIGVKVEVMVPGRPMIVGSDEMQKKEAKNDIVAVVGKAFDAVERQLEKPISAAAPSERPNESVGQSGQVVRLYAEQRHGFVEVAGSPDLYFTENAVVDGAFDEIVPGMLVHVTRATTEGPMGPQASSVRILGGRRSPE